MAQVGSLWEIDDGDGCESMSKRGNKRKRAGDGDHRERIEDFLQLNWHLLSDFERDSTKAFSCGIEPTLNMMRSHRQGPKPVIEEKPKKLPQPVQMPKTESAVRQLLLLSFPAENENHLSASRLVDC